MVPKFDSPPSTPNSFSQPRPRAPKSPGHLARIRVQNRRRAYLDRHAEYFQSSEHELADPLLYDHLIRRFQTPAEREAEGRSKGYARVLEGSLLRGEERLAKLREGTVGANGGQLDSETGTGSGTAGSHSNGVGGNGNVTGQRITPNPNPTNEETPPLSPAAPGTTTTTTTATTTTTPFSTLTATLTTPPHTRAEGREQWEAYLRDRFIRGEDGDFDDYAKVDGDDEYDELERQAREEAWFEEEEAAWEVGDDEEGEEEGRGGKGGCGTGERVLEGETGVQDF